MAPPHLLLLTSFSSNIRQQNALVKYEYVETMTAKYSYSYSYQFYSIISQFIDQTTVLYQYYACRYSQYVISYFVCLFAPKILWKKYFFEVILVFYVVFCCLVIYTIPFLWIKAVFIGAVLKQSLETERQPSSFWFFSLFFVVTLQRRMLYVCIVLAANKENQIKWRQGGLLKKQLK